MIRAGLRDRLEFNKDLRKVWDGAIGEGQGEWPMQRPCVRSKPGEFKEQQRQDCSSNSVHKGNRRGDEDTDLT